MNHFVNIQPLARQEEEYCEHSAVPSAVYEHGGQQVAGPHIAEPQQEAKGGELQQRGQAAWSAGGQWKVINACAESGTPWHVAPGWLPYAWHRACMPDSSRPATQLPQLASSTHTCGKSRGVRCTMPNATDETATAAGTGIHLVSEVSRKPRNTVSSSRGASTAVVAMSEA